MHNKGKSKGWYEVMRKFTQINATVNSKAMCTIVFAPKIYSYWLELNRNKYMLLKSTKAAVFQRSHHTPHTKARASLPTDLLETIQNMLP